MINSVKQAIVNKLAELYPTSDGYTIYDEDIPQKFKKKSFYIKQINQDYNKLLKNKYRSLLSYDVLYFSDSVYEPKNDCLEKGEKLLRGFNFINSIKPINKNTEIVDNVLHFTFDVIYTEMLNDTGIPMQTQQTNTNL